ncbi:MAG: HAMP domain-containing protein [Proteobacteria bacterium]|nr:HAMP domain-containing protein [Pseudomonadota bacterium]
MRRRLGHWYNSLTFRLTGTLVLALFGVFSITALIQLALQQRYARQSAQINGEVISEGIFGALHASMLTNDRDQLRQSVRQISARAPDLRVRIFNKQGRIVFSSQPDEEGTRLDLEAEACYRCHATGRPLTRLPPGDRTRLFRLDGHAALGIIRPIDNEPACHNAACHAHPPQRKLLGVLDTTLVLASAERARTETTLLVVVASLLALALTIVLVVWVVRGTVQRPVRALTSTLDAIGAGDLAARYEERGIAEFSHLSDALNRTAVQLERANAELVGWAQTLERRVGEKTVEVERAQQRLLRAERLASLGKLAAIVAHEINNPLASVLTYSKLLRRRLASSAEAQGALGDAPEILDAIASESKRCGDIVAGLMSFARGSGSGRQPTDLSQAAHKALFLLKHRSALGGVDVRTDLPSALPQPSLNADQLQQAVLALCVNALDAMPQGGTLELRTWQPSADKIALSVRDTGCGIQPAVLPRMFEPFFSTKGEEEGHGLGLGLTVVDGLVQENGGAIDVQSVVGEGTTFVLVFPLGASAEAAQASSDRESTHGA